MPRTHHTLANYKIPLIYCRNILGLSTLSLLLSCGIAPPKDSTQKHIFHYIREILHKIDQAEYAQQAQNKAASLYKKVPYILYAHKGEEIIFRQEAVEPPPANQANQAGQTEQASQTNILLYPTGNGSYRLTRGIYLAAGGDLFSFDRKDWYQVNSTKKSGKYSSRRSAKKNKPNLTFRIRSEVTDQTTNQTRKLLVRYRAELIYASQMIALPYKKTKYLKKQKLHRGQRGDLVQLLGRSAGNLEKLQKNNSPSLKALQKLMAHWQKLPTGQEIDLKKTTLYFPENMTFSYSFTLLGNLLRAQNKGGELHVTFLRDIYFYYPHSLFASISFDNRSWKNNYFQFDIVPFAHSVFTSPESLSYFDGLYLEHS